MLEWFFQGVLFFAAAVVWLTVFSVVGAGLSWVARRLGFSINK